MKEFINLAQAEGKYDGTSISAISNPWTIIEQHKCLCICQCICESLCICDLCCITQSYVYYNGLQQFKICGKTIIKVGYGICIKYIDCDGSEKTIKKEGCALFLDSPEPLCNHYTAHIPNPPCIKVCCNTVTAEFPVILCE